MKFELIKKRINKKQYPHLAKVTHYWLADDAIQVFKDEPVPGLFHVRIRHIDDLPIHDWSLIQEVKNFVFGSRATAIEVYPDEYDLIDNTNTYHLWWSQGMTVPNLKELYVYRDK